MMFLDLLELLECLEGIDIYQDQDKTLRDCEAMLEDYLRQVKKLRKDS